VSYFGMNFKCPECGNVADLEHWDCLGSEGENLFCNQCNQHVEPIQTDEMETDMTTPREQSSSVKQTEQFLYDLLKKPRVPTWIREKARRLIRHFPSAVEAERYEEIGR